MHFQVGEFQDQGIFLQLSAVKKCTSNSFSVVENSSQNLCIENLASKHFAAFLYSGQLAPKNTFLFSLKQEPDFYLDVKIENAGFLLAISEYRPKIKLWANVYQVSACCISSSATFSAVDSLIVSRRGLKKNPVYPPVRPVP